MNTQAPIIHDFRLHKLRWGWNGLSLDRLPNKKARMIGIGVGLKKGDFIAVNYGKEDVAHLIESIEYESNPKDMFAAILSGTYEIEDGDLD